MDSVMMKGHLHLAILAVIFWATLVAGTNDNQTQTGQVYGYKVVDIYPHDKDSFTQGLVYDKGILYEGTGGYGASSLRKVDLETGKAQKQIHLPPWIFGEGIALWKDSIIQLTWRSQLGFVYNKESFARTGNFTYKTEGWGLTSDESHLIMSDGSDVLYFLDPETFKVQEQVRVKDSRGFVRGLNELEYINGEIYANIWTSNEIAIISPKTGEVRAWIDLEGMLPEEDRAGANVLNGIAYDPLNDRLFITGKLWPKLFEIDLVAKDK
jgi:glutaminyl-peptide cyclotransferase